MRIPFEFNSFNELTVHGYKWIKELQSPKVVVVISHGMAETIERYDDFANFLLGSNIFVYGHAHRGHGHTSVSIDQLGYLGENGWDKMRVDLKSVITLAKSDYPLAKVVLFGHSMGSYVSRDLILKDSSLLDGVILSGTGYPAKLELSVGRFIAERERKQKGSFFKSERLNKMSFGAFNRKIKPNKTEFDWLSTDEEQVKRYIDNPYCGQIHPSSFFEQMAENLIRILYKESFTDQKTGLKMLLMSGDQDPVGSYGKGVKKSAEFYKNNHFDVTLKLYKGYRHEMLNEINRTQVFRDILKWIEDEVKFSVPVENSSEASLDLI